LFLLHSPLRYLKYYLICSCKNTSQVLLILPKAAITVIKKVSKNCLYPYYWVFESRRKLEKLSIPAASRNLFMAALAVYGNYFMTELAAF
jgi:hypothetical protein